MWNIQDYKENFSVSEVYHFKYSGRRKAGISLGLVEVNPVRMIIWKLWTLMTIFFKINYQANWSWCLDYLTLEIKFFFFYDQDLKFGCLLNFPSCYQKKKKSSVKRWFQKWGHSKCWLYRTCMHPLFCLSL